MWAHETSTKKESFATQSVILQGTLYRRPNRASRMHAIKSSILQHIFKIRNEGSAVIDPSRWQCRLTSETGQSNFKKGALLCGCGTLIAGDCTRLAKQRFELNLHQCKLSNLDRNHIEVALTCPRPASFAKYNIRSADNSNSENTIPT
jgi:hypothetical protein